MYFSVLPGDELGFFKTVFPVVVISNYKSISLLPHNCKFATVLSCNIDIWYAEYLTYDLPQGGCDPQVENYWSICIWVSYILGEVCNTKKQ